MESCEECEYFRGLTEDWRVGREYDVGQLTPGLKKLVEISRSKERETQIWTRIARKGGVGW